MLQETFHLNSRRTDASSTTRDTMAASKVQRPFYFTFLYPPRYLPRLNAQIIHSHRSRLFSHAPHPSAKFIQPSRTRRDANASQPSWKVASRDAMKNEMPMDLGLLPGTFIMPSGTRLPSLVYSTKHRLQLEWKRAKERFADLRGSVASKYRYLTR